VVPASERLAKGKSFLQKKAQIAKKVVHAKSQVLATRKHARSHVKKDDPPSDGDSGDAHSDDSHASGDDHSASPPASSDSDPVTTAVHAAVYSDSEDPTGVLNELLAFVLARNANTHSPSVAITHSDDARAIVTSVADHCYSNDGSDRIYLNLENAESKYFGSCSLSGQMGDCTFDKQDPFGSPSSNCLPADGGCGGGGSTPAALPGKPAIQGRSFCTCGVATVNECRCVYEPHPDSAKALCSGVLAPKHFAVLSE